MRGNRRLLVAGVIAAVVLLAVPVLAFASVWKDGGVKVTKFVELKMTGGELFETEAGTGMSCEIKATLTTEGGSTGKITSYETVKCPTGVGKMKGCELSTSTSKGLPWTVDVNTSDLTITNWHVKRTFKAGCATTELDKTIGSVTVTLLSPTAISEMELRGETTGLKITGSLTVEGTNKGTYEIS